MKRFIAVLMAASLICLVGCGKKEETDKSESAQDTFVVVSMQNTDNTQSLPDTTEKSTDTHNNASEVDISWFDDCVIIGDSLTLGLSLYNDNTGAFGNAIFICAGSLGYGNAQLSIDDPDNVHPMYRNQKILVEDAANVTGAKKAIITLGMNDIGMYGVDGSISEARNLIQKIYNKSPDIELYIQTVTPMLEDHQIGTFNNKLVKEFDEQLEILALEMGCKFLNSYEIFVDSEGNLPIEYCGDEEAMGLHFNNNSYPIWESFIKSHVDGAKTQLAQHHDIPSQEPFTESEDEEVPDSDLDDIFPEEDDADSEFDDEEFWARPGDPYYDDYYEDYDYDYDYDDYYYYDDEEYYW